MRRRVGGSKGSRAGIGDTGLVVGHCACFSGRSSARPSVEEHVAVVVRSRRRRVSTDFECAKILYRHLERLASP